MSIISWRTSATKPHTNMVCHNCCRSFFSYEFVLKDGEKCPFCNSKNTTVIKDEE